MLLAQVGAGPAMVPDIGQNWTAVILGVLGLIGTLLTVNRAKKAARRQAPTPPRASEEEVRDVSARVTELEETVGRLVERLGNRTDQYTSMRSHWYALRDAFLTFVGQVNQQWPGGGTVPPQLSDEMRHMLYQPLPVEDDPDVFDTKRRAEIRRIQLEAELRGQYPSRRDVRR